MADPSGAPADDPPGDPPAPLTVPIFRAVWIASMAANFGELIQAVAASWMMTSLANSPQLVALVQTSTSLPIMLLSLWAGAVADNLDRRVVMLCAQAFMLIVSTILAAFAWGGLLTPMLLLAFTFLIGCGTAINGPAWQSSVGDMVPRKSLPGAVALNSMGFNIARSVGPALGGAIVAAAGAAAAFAVNTASYVGLMVVLARWRPDVPERVLPREKILMAMGAGVRYVAMSPQIRTVLSRAALFGIAASAAPALLPLVARGLVSNSPLIYGLLLGAFGIGAVLGAFVSGPLRNRTSTEWIVRGASLALAIGGTATALHRGLPVILPALMLCGAGWVLALSTFNVTVQMASPRWVVGRALALYQMAAFGGMAAGSWVFGIIAQDHGVAIALGAAAAVHLGCGLVGFIRPIAQTGDLDPLAAWSILVVAIPVEPRSGPIVVTIDYRIEAQDEIAFLAVMNERARIRRRDGARNWMLLRDLGDPHKWIERYHVATWLDFIRHNERRTHADIENGTAILALHAGAEPPMVHRMIERQTNLIPADGFAGHGPLSQPTLDAAHPV